jgi:hypothetical protein
MNMRKKCVKLIIRDFFSKSKGHNIVKNQWIRIKLKLVLYLGMTKQCTKYQMNICKQRETRGPWATSLTRVTLAHMKILFEF